MKKSEITINNDMQKVREHVKPNYIFIEVLKLKNETVIEWEE